MLLPYLPFLPTRTPIQHLHPSTKNIFVVNITSNISRKPQNMVGGNKEVKKIREPGTMLTHAASFSRTMLLANFFPAQPHKSQSPNTVEESFQLLKHFILKNSFFFSFLLAITHDTMIETKEPASLLGTVT